MRLADVHVVKRIWKKLTNTRIGTLRRNKCKINPKMSGLLGRVSPKLKTFDLNFETYCLYDWLSERKTGSFISSSWNSTLGRRNIWWLSWVEACYLLSFGARVKNNPSCVFRKFLSCLILKFPGGCQHLLDNKFTTKITSLFPAPTSLSLMNMSSDLSSNVCVIMTVGDKSSPNERGNHQDHSSRYSCPHLLNSIKT